MPSTAYLRREDLPLMNGRSDGPSRLVLDSPDGQVSFALVRHSAGVNVERTKARLHGGRMSTAMRFPDEASFIQWCDTDRLRFTYPLLFEQIRRSGCALFASVE
jgi:hypothetical protein